MLNEYDNKRPLISFIITNRDYPAANLKGCAESILRLSLREEEREIIIVDDGSAEIPLEGIKPLADSIIYVRQARKGTGEARNMGLRIASGDYIQFVKGEDKLVSEAYEHCIDIVRYNSPDIVMFNSCNGKAKKNDYEGEDPVEGTEYILENDLQSSPWGYVFSKKTLMGLRFSNESYAEDDEFTTMLFLRAEKVYSTSATAYIEHGKRKDNTHRDDKRLIVKRLDDIQSVLLRLNDFSTALPVADRNAMRRRLGQLTMNYIIRIIRFTRSAKQLEARIKVLEEHGLFPLPDKAYTKKYLVFNKLSRNALVRKLLGIVLR